MSFPVRNPIRDFSGNRGDFDFSLELERSHICRGRKMRTKFFCTNFLNTARGPGHPGKIPGTSRIPFFKTQGRQSFEGGHEVFGHHPFAWKTPTPPGGLRTQKLNLCALFSFLNLGKMTSFLRFGNALLGGRYRFTSKTAAKPLTSQKVFQTSGMSRRSGEHGSPTLCQSQKQSGLSLGSEIEGAQTVKCKP